MKKIKSVSFFKIVNGVLFYSIKDCLFIIDNMIKERKIKSDSNIGDLSLLLADIIVSYNNGDSYILGNKIEYKLPYSLHSCEIIDNQVSVYKYDFDLSFDLYNNVYDIKKNELIFINWSTKEGSYIVVRDGIYLQHTNSEIKWINILRSNNWEFSLSNFPDYGITPHRQKADIKQIIGIYKDILWVYVGESDLLGIDVNTGKLIHHIENLPTYLGLTGESLSNWFKPHFHLDNDRGLLRIPAGCYYIEMELEHLTGTIKAELGEFGKTGTCIWGSSFYAEEPDRLFFKGSLGKSSPNTFGILDTCKGEIVWSHQSGDEIGYFFKHVPQINDRIFAILDDENNLLIYDRKEINI